MAVAKAGADAAPIRIFQIGAASGALIALPGTALRSSAIQLMASGARSIPLPRILTELRGALEAAPQAGFKVATRTLLAEVATVWMRATRDRKSCWYLHLLGTRLVRTAPYALMFAVESSHVARRANRPN